MMTREEVENRILDRLEGECSPAEAEAFDNALVHYPDLRDEYESLRATREHLETHSNRQSRSTN